jgi:ribosomal protein L3 glutamine methyltransferase
LFIFFRGGAPAHAGQRYDLILANPPYVTERPAIAAFRKASEHRGRAARFAHAGRCRWPHLRARNFGRQAGAHLSPDGVLLVAVGSGRALLEQQLPRLAFLWLDTSASEGGGLCAEAEGSRWPLPHP